MINVNAKLAQQCLEDCREHVAAIETDLNALQKAGTGNVHLLLAATDNLRELLRDHVESDTAALPLHSSAIAAATVESRLLRVLLVEDDFASRLLLQVFLARYGECHVAVNGREAIDAVRSSWQRGQPYDLICMDIMMPEMDGLEAVRQVRALEKTHGVLSSCGSKIVMTTTVDDIRQVSQCFQELCDAYLRKPIDLNELLNTMKSYQLVR